MKSKSNRPKEWAFLIFFISLFLGWLCNHLGCNQFVNTPMGDGLQALATPLLAMGIAGPIGLLISRRRYHKLSPQEQRDADREERDERILAIRHHAAWICWVFNCSLLCVAAFALIALDNRALLIWAGVLLCSNLLVFAAAQSWLKKRM